MGGDGHLAKYVKHEGPDLWCTLITLRCRLHSRHNMKSCKALDCICHVSYFSQLITSAVISALSFVLHKAIRDGWCQPDALLRRISWDPTHVSIAFPDLISKCCSSFSYEGTLDN